MKATTRGSTTLYTMRDSSKLKEGVGLLREKYSDFLTQCESGPGDWTQSVEKSRASMKGGISSIKMSLEEKSQVMAAIAEEVEALAFEIDALFQKKGA